MSDLNNRSFRNTILKGTRFDKSGTSDVIFSGAKLDKTQLIMMDLRKSRFEKCTWN